MLADTMEGTRDGGNAGRNAAENLPKLKATYKRPEAYEDRP